MFKKKKINSQKTSLKIINIFGILVILFVFFLWVFTINFAKKFDFFTLKETQKLEINSLEKQRENKINILLLGRGGVKNDAPNLTDSIILASINTKTKIISMFSIPRDIYVQYYNWDSWKINKIYAISKLKSWNQEFWIDALKHNVELLTKEKIDYYINVDFLGFVKFIDAIGWVEITLEKNFIDTKFPDNNWWYRTFFIKKGSWVLDWETALNFARSRHSTSDFDRSLRQQQIIKSVKNKLFEWWFFSKISKAQKFYDVFKKYVYSDVSFSDALRIFTEIKNNNYTIVSSNLNDSCFEWDPLCSKWWFLYVPNRDNYWWASVLLVNWTHKNNLNDYKAIEKYLYLVFDKNTIYKENISISILNSTKTPLLAWDLAFLLRKYWFNIPFKNHTVWSISKQKFEKSVINYKKQIENSDTIKFLKKHMQKFEFVALDDLEYSLDESASIEIIIWKNYKDVFLDIDSSFN